MGAVPQKWVIHGYSTVVVGLISQLWRFKSHTPINPVKSPQPHPQVASSFQLPHYLPIFPMVTLSNPLETPIHNRVPRPTDHLQMSESGGCLKIGTKFWVPSGKHLHHYGKSPCSMGKSTMNHHFQKWTVSLPEGNRFCTPIYPIELMIFPVAIFSNKPRSPLPSFDRLRTGSHGPSNSMIYILTMAVYHGKLLVITKGCPHFSWL